MQKIVWQWFPEGKIHGFDFSAKNFFLFLKKEKEGDICLYKRCNIRGYK